MTIYMSAMEMSAWTSQPEIDGQVVKEFLTTAATPTLKTLEAVKQVLESKGVLR